MEFTESDADDRHDLEETFAGMRATLVQFAQRDRYSRTFLMNPKPQEPVHA